MSTSLKRTPLFEAHRRANARLMDFGGWEMPVYYGSQIEEHHAVRRHAGVFDVSHMLSIDVTGPDRKSFLRRLLANDVDRIARPGQALYSCMLNPQGGVIDDLIVYGLDEQPWRLVVNAGCADKDLAWMKRVAGQFGLKVEIRPREDLAILAIQGPEAARLLAQARPEWRHVLEGLKRFTAVSIGDDLVARTGYTGEDGFEVTLPASDVESLWMAVLAQGVAPCGLGARDTLRLEAGMPLYGQEMDELTLPGEAGLSQTVYLGGASRDFVGRRAIEELDAQTQLLGLRLEGRGVMRAGMLVQTAHGAGVVTSGTMSPTLGVSVGMGRLPLVLKPNDNVHVQIRGQSVAAVVCQLPFVRHGKPVQQSLS